MKRFGVVLASAFVASAIAGCGGGGIKEGASTEPPPPAGQPPGFQDLMQKNAGQMKLKGARPKTPPGGGQPTP